MRGGPVALRRNAGVDERYRAVHSTDLWQKERLKQGRSFDEAMTGGFFIAIAGHVDRTARLRRRSLLFAERDGASDVRDGCFELANRAHER